MSSKRSFSLYELDKAIEYINDWEEKVEDASREACQKLAEIGADEARKHYTDEGGVQVSTEQWGDGSRIVAEGAEVLFEEFGTGIYYNGAAGQSPHPYGSQLHMLIGTYGAGRGARPWWTYPGKPTRSTDVYPYVRHYKHKPDVVTDRSWTRGLPATMAMYHASQKVREESIKVLKEKLE